jgi:hypothetical protein
VLRVTELPWTTWAKHRNGAGPALSGEQSAYQELLKLRQREHQVAQGRSQGRAANANSQRFQQQLQQLQLTQRENRYETQRLAQSREQSPTRIADGNRLDRATAE